MPRETLSFLSSNLVRELARLGAPLEEVVPAAVVAALRKKFAKK
ncbi:MAG: hypothetical protein ACKODZ_09045 [Verrucomicrobiota bacterium]